MGLVKSSNFPPAFNMATTAKRGKTIPVIQKPINANTLSVPETFPMEGGNIKFPAPKKMANNATLLLDCVE